MRNRIKDLRESKNISAQKLAELLNTSRGQIYQLEQGRRRLSDYWIVRLTRALHCKVEELFEGIDQPDPIYESISAEKSFIDQEAREEFNPELYKSISNITLSVLADKRVDDAIALRYINEIYDLSKETGKAVDEGVAEWYFKRHFNPEKYK